MLAKRVKLARAAVNRLSVGAGGMGGSGFLLSGVGDSEGSCCGDSFGAVSMGAVSGSQEGINGVDDFGPPNEFEVPINQSQCFCFVRFATPATVLANTRFCVCVPQVCLSEDHS